jgi:hypothetical protein
MGCDVQRRNQAEAFDFFKEASVQLITLALGAVVFSATFYKDILAGASRHHLLLECSWGLFVLSILFGILVVGGLSWQLNYATDENDLDIYSSRWTALIQLLTFLLAIGLFALFVALNMSSATGISSPSLTSANNPVIVAGPVTANGHITATGPLTATGVVSAGGPVTSTGPVTATGSITIKNAINTRGAVKNRGRHAGP